MFFKEARSNIFLQGLRVTEANIGIISNNRSLTYIDDYLDKDVHRKKPTAFHFLNSFHAVEKVPFNSKMDINLNLLDIPEREPNIYMNGKEIVLEGDISSWEQNPLDRRHTIYGNGGLLNKIVLLALEKEHNIFSWHATTLYNEEQNHMVICVGPAGTGKTIMLLHGCLREGYKVFSTELTHVKTDGNTIKLYKGSLYDTVRLGNLLEDFAEARELLDITIPDVDDIWETKLSVNFEALQTKEDIIVNPRISLLFPKIEIEKKNSVVQDIKSTKNLCFRLYFNASEKINTPRLLGGVLPYTSFDSLNLTKRRYEAMKEFVDKANIIESKSIFAGVKNCWHVRTEK